MNLKRHSLHLFILFYVIALILYYPAQNAKFVNDTFYYLYEIENFGWKGILNSYHMIFLWHIPSLAYCIIYKIFGLHWFGWHLVFCFLHSLNAYLLFILLKKIIKQETKYLSFIAALLFLISPFQTEVIAWGAALHYLLIVTFLLVCLIALIRFFETDKKKYLVCFHLSFLCSLSCFEQAFLFPFLFALFVMLIIPMVVDVNNKQITKLFFIRFFFLNMISIVGYFVLTKLVFGVWIAHYGSGTHATLNLKNMYETFLSYDFKFLLYYRYLPKQIHEYYNNATVHSVIFAVSVLLLIMFVFLILYKKRYRTDNGKVLIFFSLSYISMLVPVLNLDTSFIFEIQSDRYGYIASLFYYPLFVIIAFRLFHKFIFIPLIFTEIVVCIMLLMNAVQLWQHSGDIAFSLLQSYPLQYSQKAFIINLPDNYKGVYMFRNGFVEGLALTHHKSQKYNAETLAWINIFSNENETSTEILKDSTYYVKCLKDGKWYYYKGKGADDYENENYKVDFDEWNTAYNLTIKNKPINTTYILQCNGDQWKIVDTIYPKQ